MKTHSRVRTMSFRCRHCLDKDGAPSVYNYKLRDPFFGADHKHAYGDLPGDSESHKSLPVPEIRKLGY